MTLRTIDVERISLTLDGLPMANAQLVAAHLEAALAQAIAARLGDLAGLSSPQAPGAEPQEDTPWP